MIVDGYGPPLAPLAIAIYSMLCVWPLNIILAAEACIYGPAGQQGVHSLLYSWVLVNPQLSTHSHATKLRCELDMNTTY